MNLFEKFLGALHLNFLNDFFKRENSPSHSASLKMKDSTVGALQQAGRDIKTYNFGQKARRPQIDLENGFTVSGGPKGNKITFQVTNIGDESAVDIKWYITADDASETGEPMDLIHKLTPGEESSEVRYYYNNTEIFRRELKGLKIVFLYKDAEGNVFKSGRLIKQTRRADGNFNIYSQPGDYIKIENTKVVQQKESEVPIIEVSPDSSVSDFARYDEVNIHTRKKSLEPLVILECTFDGIPTNHGSKKLDDRDVFHFDTINKENIKDGYEPLFLLRVRKQTGEEFLFEAKLKIQLFGNRYDLMIPGDETIKPL